MIVLADILVVVPLKGELVTGFDFDRRGDDYVREKDIRDALIL